MISSNLSIELKERTKFILFVRNNFTIVSIARDIFIISITVLDKILVTSKLLLLAFQSTLRHLCIDMYTYQNKNAKGCVRIHEETYLIRWLCRQWISCRRLLFPSVMFRNGGCSNHHRVVQSFPLHNYSAMGISISGDEINVTHSLCFLYNNSFSLIKLGLVVFKDLMTAEYQMEVSSIISKCIL
jgi:hypothetical protein